MTRKAQLEHERLLAAQVGREAELKLLTTSRLSADPRYVKDVIDWIWTKVLDRKLRMNPEKLRLVDKQRRETLIGLHA